MTTNINKNYVIFEGCDCAGKTTLIKQFVKDTNHENLVVDRLHLSSIVYNRFKHRNLCQEHIIINEMFRFIKANNALFVICQPSLELIEKRFKSRGDWCIKFEELRIIHGLYHKYIKCLQYLDNFLVLDTTNENSDEYINIILSRIEELNKK